MRYGRLKKFHRFFQTYEINWYISPWNIALLSLMNFFVENLKKMKEMVRKKPKPAMFC